ncbi:MAG: UvrD-helicase domain-containing protein [Woeseiaceae bacterium]
MTGDEQLLVADRAARDDALDENRSFIVQAPAGSGKTELLIQRYLRLLSFVNEPEEIIAITFTRKAAAEMQHRVLGALRAAQQGVHPAAEHEQRTAELAAAALRRDAQYDWNLLANPRRMRVQTLDSLNAAIARSRPLLAPGSASGVRVVVDAELVALHRAAATATLDYLALTGPAHDAATEVLTHLDNNTGIYVDYLARMLGTRDQWIPFTGSGSLSAEDAAELRNILERNLEHAVRAHLERVASSFPNALRHELAGLLDYAASNLCDNDNAQHPIAALAGLADLPAAEPSATEQWRGVAELLLTLSGTFRKQVDKRQGFPPGGKAQKDTIKALLAELATHEPLGEALHEVRALPPVRYTDEQWTVLLALFRLLPLASVELRRLFAEQGVADHIDIAMTAGEALGTAQQPGDVALLLDYQVRHLLVDEMQDTSSAQYRMLEALTGGWEANDGRTLFCVGDPMQSIYRFRNAEVGQFLLARAHGIGEVRLAPLTLRRNFRSGAQLVDWFNAVFPRVMSARDDPSSGAVSYSEALSVPQLAGLGQCVVHPLFGNDKEQEAKEGLRTIVETLARYPDDSMAVLVRGRNQLAELLAELRHAGVDYRAIEIDKLTDLPEVIEVLALTRAAVHPGDRAAWLGILRAPWIGLDWSDLHSLVVNDRQSMIIELLRDDERIAGLSKRAQDVIADALPVLEKLVAARPSKTLRDLVEDSWLALGGPAILNDRYAVDNVYRYFDVLAKHERHGSLDDVAALESLLDLERVSTSGNARLQVMTMHRAKGLEFEHVLLYGLGRLPGKSGRSVLSWFDIPNEHGEERKIISPVGPRVDVENDPVHRYIELTSNSKDRNEQARLLYVACTRARVSLHLLGHTQATPEGCKPPAKNSLLHLLWPAVENEFAAAFSADAIVRGADEETSWRIPRLRRFTGDWTVPDISPPPGVVIEQPASGEVDDEVEFYWVGTEARIAGTIVHRWMQALAEGRAESADSEDQRRVTARWLREMGISDDLQAGITDRVHAALDSVRNDDKGNWILAGDGHAELALTGIVEGEIESVILDRVRIDEHGDHWIIDYKTSSHEGGNLQGFLNAEVERYTAQLQKYAAIYGAWSGKHARCALYFPLLREFVEV